ncbi:MAG: hypothetical protein QQN63_00700 [Nitrosopumilus sp.]
MKQVTVRFGAREVGALGLAYKRKETVNATSDHDALMQLYEHYEHFSNVVGFYYGPEEDTENPMCQWKEVSLSKISNTLYTEEN